MKKTFTLLVVAIATHSLVAQNFKLPECNDMTERVTSLDRSNIFSSSGINLGKYDWSNPTLNCHINKTTLFAKKAKAKKAGAIASVTVGGIFLMGGASILAQTGGGGGAALTALGSAGICGSVPLFIFRKKDKRNMNYHLDQVSQYYQHKKWF